MTLTGSEYVTPSVFRSRALAPFGISRCSAFRAVGQYALFGSPRS